MPDTTIRTEPITTKSQVEPEAKKTRLVADTKRAYDAITMAAWATAGRDDLIELRFPKRSGNPLCTRAPFTGPRHGRRAAISTSSNDGLQTVLANMTDVKRVLGRWWDVFMAWDGSIGGRPDRKHPDLYPKLEELATSFEWNFSVADDDKKTEFVQCRLPQETMEQVRATGIDPAEFFRKSIALGLLVMKKQAENENL